MSDLQILKRETFKVYRYYCEQFEAVYSFLKRGFSDSYVDEICKMRGYVSQEQRDLLAELQIGKCDIADTSELGDLRKDLGLVALDKQTNTERFLLGGRYIIAIRDVQGNLIALVGWYPDYKKYITTPSPFFSKNAYFFNFEHAYELSWEKYDGCVILVEGLFDALSLRSIGLPVIATMGVTVNNPKSELLKLFKKVVAMPDNDSAGKKALARGTKHSWIVPPNTTFVRVEGYCHTEHGDLKVKDADNLVSYFDPDSVREVFLDLFKSKKDLEIIRL